MSIKAILYLVMTLSVWLKTFKTPVVGVSFFAMIVFVRPETIAYYQLQFMRISLVTGLLCLTAYFIRKRELAEPIHTSILTLFVLFYFSTVISTANSSVIPLWRWSNSYLSLLIFGFLMTRTLVDKAAIHLFVFGILLGSAFLAVWGFDQHFRGNIRLEGVGGNRFGSNEFGAILASMFPLFLMKARGKIALFQQETMKKMEVLFFLVTTPILLATIQFTGSRGAFLGLVVGVGMLMVRAKKKKVSIAVMVLLLPFAIAFAPAEYKERMITIFNPSIAAEVSGDDTFVDDDDKVDGSVSGRIVFWKAAIAMWKDHPILGVGLQNFELLTPTYTEGRYGRKDTHNTYLKILAELGVVGFLCFMGMIYCALKNLRMTRKITIDSQDDTLFYYQYAIEAGLVGLLVSSLTGSYNYNEPLFWFLFLSASVRQLSEKKPLPDHAILTN